MIIEVLTMLLGVALGLLGARRMLASVRADLTGQLAAIHRRIDQIPPQ